MTLTVLGQVPIYPIVDALDEFPNTPKVRGAPPSRQKVLGICEGARRAAPSKHVPVRNEPVWILCPIYP
jgi:hypothetical protein